MLRAWSQSTGQPRSSRFSSSWASRSLVVVWLVLTRVFTNTRAGRHAAHFLDVGGADMPPEQRIKYNNNHPGAGGNG